MKKLRGLVLMLLISLSLFGLTACQGDENNATYEQITPQQAKEIMDTEQDYIIIDARTEEEFAEGHIENAILIPEYEIINKAEKELPDKDALILVYCRSGRRSKIASEELVKLGYTNVKEFGGIIDWPYETVR
ncbi:MAG: rhodanese-like domain-containing protein [Clostridia bacterium]|nr:rhodanese-like domain-containing protein [Clostridia bacterium]